MLHELIVNKAPLLPRASPSGAFFVATRFLVSNKEWSKKTNAYFAIVTMTSCNNINVIWQLKFQLIYFM